MGKAQLKSVIEDNAQKQKAVKPKREKKEAARNYSLLITRIALAIIFLMGILMYFFFS
jgi:flagellar basal body-associated protein FliL